MQRVISLFQTESYCERFPAMRTLCEENLFLEVDCYNLLIPVRTQASPEFDADIFADTVLRFLSLERNYTANQIADMMCVDPDFIRFIFARLRECGYLNEKGRITVNGVKRISRAAQARSGNAQQNAYAFAVPGTHDFLSYIRTEALSWEDVADRRQDSFTISIGSAGRSTQIKGRLLASSAREAKTPNRSLFPKLIRRYNQLCGEIPGCRPVPYQEGYAVDPAQESSVILHCKLAIQEGAVDHILLSDGFSIHCENLWDYVRKKRPELEKELLSRATRRAQSDGSEDGEEAPPDPGAGRYGEVTRRLQGRQNLQGDSMDALAEADLQNQKSVRELGEAVEWALFYFVQQNPPDPQRMELLRRQSSAENYITLLSLAEEIGINCAWEYKPLFCQLSSSRIDRCFERGSPELCVLLPVAVAAAVGDRTVSFHRLLAEMPGALDFLLKLKKLSARVRHKAGVEESVEIDPKRLERDTFRFVELLLPDLQLDGVGGAKYVEGASQRRINARYSLSEALGWDLFRQLDRPLQEELFLISPDKTQQECPPAHEFVFTLSRVLEYMLQSVLRQVRFRADADKAEVLDKIQSVYHVELPEPFQCVTPQFLKDAMQGREASLNAYFLAFLYCCARRNPDDARPFLEEEVLDVVGTISSLRGHTGQAAYFVPYEQLLRYRERVFQIIMRLAKL